jgi:DNA-binding transcriptional MerR regulator
MVESTFDSNASFAGRRPIAKAAGAFRTISEVATELDIPPHVLRFWETRFSQIRPLKRGGGRRYYRPEDIDLLRRIRELLYRDGYTIKGVQRLLRDGASAVRAAAEAPESARARARLDDPAGEDGEADAAEALEGEDADTAEAPAVVGAAAPGAAAPAVVQPASPPAGGQLSFLGTAGLTDAQRQRLRQVIRDLEALKPLLSR